MYIYFICESHLCQMLDVNCSPPNVIRRHGHPSYLRAISENRKESLALFNRWRHQERAGGESCMPGTELELGENIVDSYGKVSLPKILTFVILLWEKKLLQHIEYVLSKRLYHHVFENFFRWSKNYKNSGRFWRKPLKAEKISGLCWKGFKRAAL